MENLDTDKQHIIMPFLLKQDTGIPDREIQFIETHLLSEILDADKKDNNKLGIIQIGGYIGFHFIEDDVIELKNINGDVKRIALNQEEQKLILYNYAMFNSIIQEKRLNLFGCVESENIFLIYFDEKNQLQKDLLFFRYPVIKAQVFDSRFLVVFSDQQGYIFNLNNGDKISFGLSSQFDIGYLNQDLTFIDTKIKDVFFLQGSRGILMVNTPETGAFSVEKLYEVPHNGYSIRKTYTIYFENIQYPLLLIEEDHGGCFLFNPKSIDINNAGEMKDDRSLMYKIDIKDKEVIIVRDSYRESLLIFDIKSLCLLGCVLKRTFLASFVSKNSGVSFFGDKLISSKPSFESDNFYLHRLLQGDADGPADLGGVRDNYSSNVVMVRDNIMSMPNINMVDVLRSDFDYAQIFERKKFTDDIRSKHNSGGISLNPASLNLQTQGQSVDFSQLLNPAYLESLKDAPGLKAIILDIKPITVLGIEMFLGLKNKDDKDAPTPTDDYLQDYPKTAVISREDIEVIAS